MKRCQRDHVGRFWKSRKDGPITEGNDGSKLWMLGGQIHRTNGPAFERAWDGANEWWFYGKYDRTEFPDGTTSLNSDFLIDDMYANPALPKARQSPIF